MKTRAGRILGGVAALSLAASLQAQEFIIHPPSSTLTLPNYNMMSIGQVGGLQAGAFVARANDSSSNWYNPAGLALATRAQISSSAGSYTLFNLVPEDLTSDDSGNSSQQIPALVGVVVKHMFGDDKWTAGFAVVRTNSFEQETDAEISSLDLTPGHLLDYSADSSYRRTEVSAGVGYTCNNRWRLGATIGGALTSLRAVGSVFDQRVQTTGLDAGLVSRRASGSITQLRLTAGAQYQVTDEILLGAVARSPGIDLFRSGEFSSDALAHQGSQTASLAFFDPNPHFDYKLPFQASVGAAIVKDRFQAEVDVLFAAGSSPYDLFTSDRTATLIFDDGGGGTPIVSQVPFTPVISENRAVVNVAAGGSYVFSQNRVWTVYLGFNTDFSPVGDADQYFSRVDLYGITGGVSGTVAGFTAAVGVNYQWGDASNVPLADILDSNISVDAISVIYSIAYKF